MPRTKVVLRSQARKMVYDVYCYIKQAAETEKDTLRHTAEATKTSERTVRRIVKEGKSSDIAYFKTPGKKRQRKKIITDIDAFDQSVIRNCVHNYHITNKELPTVQKLLKKLKHDIDFNGSERSLHRILNNLGFRWKRAGNKRKLMIEKSNIRLQRIEYLEKIMKYRQEGRPIVYIDVSHIDSSHLGPKTSEESLKGSKKPITKGQKVVIVHAASEAGFVPNALLLFKSATNTAEFQDTNYENYEIWLRSQLIPNLPRNAVLIIDNASYNTKQYDPVPSSNAKRAEMMKWLTEKKIKFESKMLKPQLYRLIKNNKEQYKKYIIDKLVGEHNFRVLRLPSHHSELSPMEMAWEAIRGYVAGKNISWDATTVMELVKEKVALMGADVWSQLCDEVRKIESDYIQSDNVVDTLTEQFIVYDSNESESSASGSSDSSSIEYEEPTPSISSVYTVNYMPFATLTRIKRPPSDDSDDDSD